MHSMSRGRLVLTLVSFTLALTVHSTSFGQTKVKSNEGSAGIYLPTSPLAEKARARRNRAHKSAAKDYQKIRAKANREYLADLDEALKNSLKKDQIEESQRIKSEIKRLRVETAAQSADRVYLADLPPADVRISYGELGLNGDLGYEDRRVIVNKQQAKHSVSTHAKDDGVASVDYVMPQQFSVLSGATCLNSSSKKSSMNSIFRIVGDGRILWESPKATKKPVPFQIDVSGISHLRLQITTKGNSANGHTVWLDPVLTH